MTLFLILIFILLLLYLQKTILFINCIILSPCIEFNFMPVQKQLIVGKTINYLIAYNNVISMTNFVLMIKNSFI